VGVRQPENERPETNPLNGPPDLKAPACEDVRNSGQNDLTIKWTYLSNIVVGGVRESNILQPNRGPVAHRTPVGMDSIVRYPRICLWTPSPVANEFALHPPQKE
jgi:hypothetical protein